VIVRNDFFEFEVDEIVRIEGTLLLLWFRGHSLVEIPVSTSSRENAGTK